MTGSLTSLGVYTIPPKVATDESVVCDVSDTAAPGGGTAFEEDS